MVNINNNYIFDGTLNLNELFKITDVYQFVIEEQKNVESGKLAETFEDLSPKLSSIEFSIKDLLDPFQYGYYYKKEIGGSFSIKSILPAMFPNEPSLNYHNLEGVHNGTEAMTLFPKIKDLPLEEQEKERQNLLKYCELDTFAMVKIWQKLKNVVKD